MTGLEIVLLGAAASTIYASALLATAMVHLAAATTLGAALIAIAHGTHAGLKLAQGIKKIRNDKIRGLVRVNFRSAGRAIKQTFVIHKPEGDHPLRIYKIKTETLVYHKSEATTYTWTVEGPLPTIPVPTRALNMWSGFVTSAKAGGLVSGDIEHEAVRIMVGDMLLLLSQSLHPDWTGLVAELQEDGLMETRCDYALQFEMSPGSASLRYFKPLAGIMDEYVDVF